MTDTKKTRLKAAFGFSMWIVCAAASASAFSYDPTRVVLVSPRDKATEFDVQAPMQIHFSNGLKLPTIIADSVRVLNPAGIEAQLDNHRGIGAASERVAPSGLSVLI